MRERTCGSCNYFHLYGGDEPCVKCSDSEYWEPMGYLWIWDEVVQ